MNKILTFAGIGALLIVLSLVVINFTGNDTSKADLENVYKTNSTIISLSKLAQKSAGSYNVKVVATNIATTTASDSTQISSYYNKRYGKALKLKKPSKEEVAADPSTLLASKEEGIDFDTQYKKSVQEQLEANLNQIRTLYNSSQKSDLRAVLEGAYTSTQKNLEQLKQLSSTSSQ